MSGIRCPTRCAPSDAKSLIEVWVEDHIGAVAATGDDQGTVDNLGRDPDGDWQLFVTTCANCERLILMLRQHEVTDLTDPLARLLPGKLKRERMVWPRAVSR